MTRSFRWTVWHLLVPLCLIPIGCTEKPLTVSQSDGNAMLASAQMTPDISARNAAALERLNHTDSVAETVKAIDTARDVAMDNLSNAQTQAFKAARLFFEGGGKINVQLDLAQGSLENTGGPLDVGIQGPGFIAVKVPDSQGGTAYTRAGNFTLNNEGDLVIAIGDGYKLMPPITLPTNATNISIGCDGTVQYVKAGSTTKSTAGQIKLAMFPNPQGLAALGGSIYASTETSGPATTSVPGTSGTGQVLSGFLESSNVNVTRETLRLQVLNEWRADLLRAVGIH